MVLQTPSEIQQTSQPNDRVSNLSPELKLSQNDWNSSKFLRSMRVFSENFMKKFHHPDIPSKTNILILP